MLGARLSESDMGKRVSVLDAHGDVLIVPQATLGGRLKGKLMQYHNNIEKSIGLQLYLDFATSCQARVENNAASHENQCSVKWGTYGNRQVLQIDTNGPYSHVIEF